MKKVVTDNTDVIYVDDITDDSIVYAFDTDENKLYVLTGYHDEPATTHSYRFLGITGNEFWSYNTFESRKEAVLDLVNGSFSKDFEIFIVEEKSDILELVNRILI